MGLISTFLALGLGAGFTQGAVPDSGTGWRVNPPVVSGNLAIYPVVATNPSARYTISAAYITLDEGIKAGTVEISEKGGVGTPIIRNRTGQTASGNQVAQQGSGGGAEVNELMLVNKSGKKLILLAGEMVVGGKQDRIVQNDAIIPPGKNPVALNVFCVEQGRWAGSSTQFTAGRSNNGGGGAFADPTVRGAAQGGSQQHVWNEVASKNAKSGATPGITTYQETLKSKANTSTLQVHDKAISMSFPKKGVIGAIVAVNGKLIWADVFVDAALFSKYSDKLLQSYMIEAATERGAGKRANPTVMEAERFMQDRSGVSSFTGQDNIFKLQRYEGKASITQELMDIASGANLLVHLNKMLKKQG